MSVIDGQPVDAATTNAAFMSRTAATTSTIAAVTISNTTESTTKDTGALIVDGGVGIEKNLNVGGDAVITGNLTVNGTTTSVSTTNTEIKDANIILNKGGTQASADASTSGFTVEMSDATEAIVGYDSTLQSKFKAGDVGNESEILTSTHQQSVYNKSFYSGNVYEAKTDHIMIATPSAPASGYMSLYAKSDKKFYTQDSTGVETQIGASGDGFKNFIQTGDGGNTQGWSLFNDSGSYVDGTGGSPVATFSSISSTIDGAQAFRLDPDNVTNTGDGVSYTASIDEAYRGRYATVRFFYKINGVYTPGTYEVYIYDVTNSAIVDNWVLLDDGGYVAQTIREILVPQTCASLRFSIYASGGPTMPSIDFDTVFVGYINELVDKSTTQIITGEKWLDQPVIIEEKGSTPASPSAGYMKLYPKTDRKIYKLDSDGVETEIGTGTGSSSDINYIVFNNGDATTGWSTFNDATNFTDGTGGSPTATWTSSATTPLRGSKSFLFTAGGAGDGVSYDFTIDSADKAKVIQISFDYGIVTPASFTDNDYEIWIYDVTNAVAIQPTPYQLVNTSLVGYFQAQFQTASNSTSYRLSIYQKDGTTSNVKFDNIVVGPRSVSIGSVITEWKSYTPTLYSTSGSITNATPTAFWRRVGGQCEILGQIAFSAASAAFTDVFISYPSGVVLDTAKYTATNGNSGQARYRDTGVASYNGVCSPLGAVTDRFLLGVNATNTSDAGSATDPTLSTGVTNAFPFTFGNTDAINFEIKIPVLGWGATTSMSTLTSGRTIAVRATRGTDQSGTATTQKVTLNSAVHDTAGWFDGVTNNRINIYETGWYHIDASLRLILVTSGEACTMTVWKNYAGSALQLCFDSDIASSGSAAQMANSTDVYLQAGDYIELYAGTAADTSYTIVSGYTTFLSLHKIQGPQQIQASEQINEIYITTAGQSIANATTSIVDFETKVKSTHGSVTTGASWKYTAQRYQVASVSVTLRYASASFTQGTNVNIRVFKNGVEDTSIRDIGRLPYTGTYSPSTLKCSFDIELNTGDYFDIRTNHDESSSRSLDTNNCRIQIKA